MNRLLTFILTISLLLSCNNQPKESEENTAQPAAVRTLNYAVVNTFPHDTTLYTEGFLIHDGRLFESTGSPDNMEETRSLIGIDDLKTGKFDKKAEIDRTKYFGEGIVFFNNKLYQLTYKNKLGFIYDANSFKPLGKFIYSNAEGWGLSTDGNNIIMTDGTENITFLSPNNLKPIRTLRVTENGLPLIHLNEIEFIKGFIYANIWTTNDIAKIDPSSGKVVAKLDLTSLVKDAKDKSPNSEVLNGIAYDSTSDKIFVTGKLWPNIYQIDFAH